MDRAYWLKEGAITEGSLDDCFPFLHDGKRHVLALVGAGGKTTLMYALAQRFCRRGYKTAVTTTTRIQWPDHCGVCRALADCRTRWERREYAVFARELESGKLGALKAEDLAALLGEADQAVVEADGARRMACKVPAAHEPVIPDEADTVIGVVGLDVLGRSVEEACFRPEEAAALLGCGTDHVLTPGDLATILRSERGTRKNVGDRAYYTVLNKCDDAHRRSMGEQVLRLLDERACMTCFDPASRK